MAARTGRAETILHLSETATVTAKPDELSATLAVESIAPTAADAQQRVNAAMADALTRAHQTDGVSITTGGYSVLRVGPTTTDRIERWQASQSLGLRGKDGPAMLKLVGELQQRGLAVGQLGWRLSDDGTRSASQEAIASAIKALRGRADAAAALLNLQFDSFREVRLDVPLPMPVPRMFAAQAKAADATPPSAEAADVPVTATAEADVLLKPR